MKIFFFCLESCTFVLQFKIVNHGKKNDSSFATVC